MDTSYEEDFGLILSAEKEPKDLKTKNHYL